MAFKSNEGLTRLILSQINMTLMSQAWMLSGLLQV